MSNQNQNGGNFESPTMPMTKKGEVWSTTLESLAVSVNEQIHSIMGIPEIDNVEIIPIMDKKGNGQVRGLHVVAYFYANNGGNIFKRNKNGFNKGSDGRINTADIGYSKNAGPFGYSDNFRNAIGAICKWGDNGKPIISLKAVDQQQTVASLELDPDEVIALALGIRPEDNYACAILGIQMIPGTINCTIDFMKYRLSNNNKKSRNQRLNYSKLAQENYKRVNRGVEDRNSRRF